MKTKIACVLAALLAGSLLAEENHSVAASDVTWTSLGTNENNSLPIGNGDLAANVWTESNGDVLLLLAKADAEKRKAEASTLTPLMVQMHAYDALGKLGGSGTTIMLGDFSRVPAFLFPNFGIGPARPVHRGPRRQQ